MKKIVPDNPSIMACIGTFCSYPYIHAQLEVFKRYNPDVTVLIHDDCSPQKDKLHALADQYGAHFVSTQFTRIPTVGDMSAHTEAIRFAADHGIDIAVKVSRRMIIAKPWAAGLRELAENYQMACYTAPCSHYAFGFRSELTAMVAKPWIDSGAYNEMQGYVDRNEAYDSLPESYYHRKAREVHSFVHRFDPNCMSGGYVNDPNMDMVVRYESCYKRPDNYDGYGIWPLMGMSRHQFIRDLYWHDSCPPHSYFMLSQSLGLPYIPSDFDNANAEHGSCF